MMAAGQAAQAGARTILLEKMHRPGRKLMITGKGRCNLTNVAPMADFIEHIHPDGRFLRQAFAAFFHDDLMQFFTNLGVSLKVERGGRVFPESNTAREIVDAMIRWLNEQQVRIITGTHVKKVQPLSAGRWSLRATTGRSGNETRLEAKAVILATGGKSYPATGSSGDGYRIAERLGHVIQPVRPALVPLMTSGDTAKKLEGLSLKNVSASVWIDGKKRAALFGEMLFTNDGLSGPIILTMSRQVVDALHAHSTVEIAIDLKPALDDHQLDARLLRDLARHPNRSVRSFLKGLLPRTLISVCLEQLGLDGSKLCHQLTAKERKRLRLWLKSFRFEVVDCHDFHDAIITAGGIGTKDVNPRSMQSKLNRGLFFAGELLDLDADTGGFNLQIAFSTGWLAGQQAARYALETTMSC